MSEQVQQNPSTDSTGSGVFEGIRGAKSRDPEVEAHEAEEKEAAAQASEKAPEKSGQTEPEPKAQKAEGGDNAREVQARQRIAQLERRLAEMGPWAQLAQALNQDPGGREILEKLQRGEALMAGDPSKQEIADRAGLSKQELVETLNQRDAINRQITELTELAEDRLPDYKKIRKNPQFVGLMDAAMASVWNGSIPLHPDVSDWQDEQAAKNFTALAFAHEMYLMRNPKVKEAVKQAGKNEERDRTAAKLAASVSSGTTTAAGEEKRLSPEEQVKFRMLNSKGVGKSFSKAFGRS